MAIPQEVTLHAGLHKTGTSSIQETMFLSGNNTLLATTGLIYPTALGVNHSYRLFSAFCDQPELFHDNIRKRYDAGSIDLVNSRSLEALASEVAERDGQQVVLSAEELTSLTESNLARLKHFITTALGSRSMRIVIYVRNPIDWTVSIVQEKVKWGMSYEAAVNDVKRLIPGLYRDRIEKFSNVFGENFVQVYRFETAVDHDFGVVGHFLTSIGVKQYRLTQMEFVRANERSSQVSVEIMSYINERLPLTEDGKKNAKREFVDVLPLLRIGGTAFDLPLHEKEWIMRVAHDDIAWLGEWTGIDYLDWPLVSRATDGDLTEEVLGEIHAARAQLSEGLVQLVDEYIQGLNH